MRSGVVDTSNATVATCGVAIMAKGSVPGHSKTRLVPPLTFDQAAQCNTAFVRDVAENILAASAQTPIAGYVASPSETVYCATKFAVQGFTDGLRREVGRRGVQVTLIAPGPIKTEFMARIRTGEPAAEPQRSGRHEHAGR